MVLFFTALVSITVVSGLLAFSSLGPSPYVMPDVQYWATDTDGNPQTVTLGPPVTQAQYDAAETQHKHDGDGAYKPLPIGARDVVVPPGVSIQWAVPLRAQLQMPDGSMKDFIGKSDEEIKTSWTKALYKITLKRWLGTIVIMVVTALVVSYALQVLYRALLYVIYGAASDFAPAPHHDEHRPDT